MRKSGMPSNFDMSHETEATSTIVISNRELTLDGVKFHWWAVGEDPSLVTIRSSIFGSLAEFTRGDLEAFATALAKKLLAQHYERAEQFRRASKKRSEGQDSALHKRGWFE